MTTHARRTRQIGLFLAGAGIFALLCWRFGLSDITRALVHIRPGVFAAYVLVSIAILLGYSLRWLAVCRALGGRSSLAEIWAARVASDAVGGLVPGARVGGDPLRIALVTAAGTAGTLAAAGVAIDRLLELIGNTLCTIACVTVYVLADSGEPVHRVGLAVIGAMIALLVSLVVLLVLLRRGRRPLSSLLPSSFGQRHARVAAWLSLARQTEDDMISFFQHYPAVFLRGLAWTIAIEGAILVQYYLLLSAFGVHVALPTLLLSTVTTGLARIVPTPGGFGAMEGAQVTLFAVATGKPAVGFVVGLLIRLHELLWTIVGLVVLMPRWFTLHRLLRTTA